MKYLVTGGCGFIGSHLVHRLLKEGHSVIIIDDLSSGKLENIPSSAEVIIGDVTAPGIFDSVIGTVDGCFHLAAIVSVEQSAQQLMRANQVNLGGVLALLAALVKRKRKIPVVLTSSAAVYGENQDIPLEETGRCAPLSAYGIDKYACELHANATTLMYGIPIIALRFFNVYGPRQNTASAHSGIIPILAKLMQKNSPVTIFGDGYQSRDFVYVDDAVEGMMRSIAALESKSLSYGVFNICTGIHTSINGLANIIGQIYQSHSIIKYAKRRTFDIRFSLGAPGHSKNVLGFKASVPLLEGLKRTLQSYGGVNKIDLSVIPREIPEERQLPAFM